MSQFGNTMSITGKIAYEVGDKLMTAYFWEAGSLRGTGLATVGARGVERESCVVF